MENGQVVPNSFYVYAPNKVAPICFTAVFALSAIAHIWQCFHYKSWKINGLHPLCGVLFAAGFATREVNAWNNYMYTSQLALGIYIASQVCIYICPPLLELANYHILGRVFYYVPHIAPVAPGNVLAIFGGLMGVVEALNSLGVAFTSNPTGNKQELGKALTLVAVGLQVCVIASFACMAGIFCWRYRKANIKNRVFPTLPITLYISMSLILIRSVYRIVEHAGNSSPDLDNPQELESLSPLLRYEWFFYVFEASTMCANMLLWNVFSPGRYLPTKAKIFLAEDGVTEMIEPEIADKEPVLAQVGYIAMQVLTFGLWGMIVSKKTKNNEKVLSEDSDDSLVPGHQV